MEIVYVLAGGLGTRISTLYPNVPKAIIPIAGKPFLWWKIEQLKTQGFQEIKLLLGYGSQQIINFVKNEFPTLDIKYLTDGEHLLGTAGSVSRALEGDKRDFVLTFGDNLLPFNAGNFVNFARNKNGSTMTATTYQGPSDIRNVSVEYGKVTEYSKSNNNSHKFVDFGMYYFREIDWNIDKFQNKDLGYVINCLVESGRMFALEIDDHYFEIGTQEGLKLTEEYLLAHQKKTL